MTELWALLIGLEKGVVFSIPVEIFCIVVILLIFNRLKISKRSHLMLGTMALIRLQTLFSYSPLPTVSFYSGDAVDIVSSSVFSKKINTQVTLDSGSRGLLSLVKKDSGSKQRRNEKTP